MSSQQLPSYVRIERATASTASPATDAAPAGAVSRETCPCLRRGMRASIVRRCNLDVVDTVASVRPFKFDPQIGKVDMTVEEREIVLLGPCFDFPRGTVWPSIGIRPIPVALMEEFLILAFELV